MSPRTLSLSLAVALAATGCTHVHHHDHGPARVVKVTKPGPPAHAPARGHRRKHGSPPASEVKRVFDSELGVHVVVGWPAHYFHQHRYYRHVDGVWHVSPRLEGGWVVVEKSKLPPGLRKHRAKQKHHRKHGHPAKHRH